MITGTTANWTFGTSEIAKPERDPYSKVIVHWEKGSADETANVKSLQGRGGYEDSITGMVPSGAISGDLDVTLKSGSKYSAFNPNSALYGSRRLNCNVQAYTGFTVSGTDQYLQQIEGKTSSLDVQSLGRETNLHVIDKSELLKRKTITWPLMSQVPSSEIIRSALAEVGIGDGQTNDEVTKFMVKFDGSVTTEQGVNPCLGLPIAGYAAGRWGSTGSGVVLENQLFYEETGNYFDSGFITFWAKHGTHALHGNYVEIRTSQYTSDGIVISTTGGTELRMLLRNGAGTTKPILYTGSAISNDWFHVGVTWDKTIDNVSGYINGSLIATGTMGTLLSGLTPAYISLEQSIGTTDHVSAGTVQRTPGGIRVMAQAQSPDDEQTTIEEGKNTIDWLYVNEKNAWELIKEICQAEGATFRFDGLGKAHFENRYHLLNVPHNTSQKTISYDADTIDLGIREDIDQVANRVVVKSNPLEKQNGTAIWDASGTLSIPPSSTREFWASYDSPAAGVITTFTASEGVATGSSTYHATDDVMYTDMTGSVYLYGTAFAESMKILGSNVHPSKTAYLVDFEGAPAVHIWGSSVKTPDSEEEATDKIYAVAENTDSQTAYGTRSVEIENNYITSFDYAEWMAEYIVTYYHEPKARVEGITIMADPRLEVGDRITLQDASGVTGIDNDFWILDIDWNMGPPYTQDLKVAYADESSFLILDHGTQGRLDYNILAF